MDGSVHWSVGRSVRRGRSLARSIRRSRSVFSVGYAVYQLGSPFVGRSVGHSVSRSVTQSVGRSVIQSLGRLFSKSIGHFVGRSVGHPVSRSVIQSVDRLYRRSVGLSVDRSLSYLERGFHIFSAPFYTFRNSHPACNNKKSDKHTRYHKFPCLGLGSIRVRVCFGATVSCLFLNLLEDNNSQVFAWCVLRLFCVVSLCPLLSRSTRLWRRSL